jgi:bifunctional non-homologous end joining protein LigD
MLPHLSLGCASLGSLSCRHIVEVSLNTVRKNLIPDRGDAIVEIEGKQQRITNLHKAFWPELGITKGDLIRYYTTVSPALLPHIRDRAMVMRRYPHGAHGKAFFMKNAPTPRPEWIRICPIEHEGGDVQFPVIDDLASLVWVVNLGCIDLNQWYARTDDVDRPDYLHFDLDPGSAAFDKVLETALYVREGLTALNMPAYVKTSGSKGLHLYVPIVRGPTQTEVWTVARALAIELAARAPKLVTAEYAKSRRPKGRVLLDFNQNQWGRTLASIYSVRPTKLASVSMPVTWREVEKGLAIEDFTMNNAPARIKRRGDLWKPVLHDAKGRFDLTKLFVERADPSRARAARWRSG